MKVVIRSECVSPHLNPFLSKLNKLVDELIFVYSTTEQGTCRRVVGWNMETDFAAIHDQADVREMSEESDILIEMLREMDILEKRAKAGLRTFYCGERWFKPRAGMLRLLSPSYFMMARRFVSLLSYKAFSVLPMGIHAARDFIRLALLFNGNLKMLFTRPKVAFESRPGGVIVPLKDVVSSGLLSPKEISFARRNGYIQIPEACWGKFRPSGVYSKMRLWGYFVESGKASHIKNESSAALSDGQIRVLWAGRMLWWKRTIDLIKAARYSKRLKVDIYGQGPCLARLERACKDVPNVSMHGYIRNDQLREEMHKHDIYVLPSNAYEGWGAVVSEALSEGVTILATAEAGASATILPIDNLFNAGDVAELCKKISMPIKHHVLGPWNGDYAAKAFMDIVKETA